MKRPYREQVAGYLVRPGLDRTSRHLGWITALVSLGDEDIISPAIACGLEDDLLPRMIQEAILQTYLFAGYPKVINGLILLNGLCAGSGLDYPVNGGTDEDYPYWPQWEKRGESLCRSIYGDRFDRLQAMIEGLHPSLARWMIVEGYGKVLGRDGLPRDLREILVVSVLTSQGVWRQLRSHLLGGLHLGVTREALREIVIQLRPFISPDQVEKALDILDGLIEGEAID